MDCCSVCVGEELACGQAGYWTAQSRAQGLQSVSSNVRGDVGGHDRTHERWARTRSLGTPRLERRTSCRS